MRMIQYPDDMDSKFKFIAIAAQRCRQLQKGAKPRVTSRSKKFTTIAQEEVLARQVQYYDGPPPVEGIAAVEAEPQEQIGSPE
jgi:DNA-directed RNA polymerase subunit K/omega